MSISLTTIKIFRIALEKFGVHRLAKLPKFVANTAQQLKLVNQVANSKHKVAIFTTCYHNYNEPGVVKDFYEVLKHNNVTVEIITDNNCCGMPKLELGNIEQVSKMMNRNLLSSRNSLIKDI